MKHSNELVSQPNSIQAPQMLQDSTTSAISLPNASTTVKLEFLSEKGSEDPHLKLKTLSTHSPADLTWSPRNRDSSVALEKHSSRLPPVQTARYQKKYFLLDGDLADTLTVCHRIQDVRDGRLDEALDLVVFEGIKYIPSYFPAEALKYEAVRTTLETMSDRVTSPGRLVVYTVTATGEVLGPKSTAANTESSPQVRQLTDYAARKLLATKCLVENIGDGGESSVLSPDDTIRRLIQAYVPSASMTEENRKKAVRTDAHRRARYYLPPRKEMEKLLVLDDTAVVDQVRFIEDQVLPWARGCDKSTEFVGDNLYDLEIWFRCLTDYEREGLAGF